MEPEPAGDADICPRCGSRLSFDPGTGLWFCAGPDCNAVVSARQPPSGADAPAPSLTEAAAARGPCESPPAAHLEVTVEVRPRRGWRALLATGAVVTAVAVLAMELSPSLWSGHPSLSVTPHELAFDEGPGGAVLPLAFAIENGGRGRLDWQVHTDAAWLTLAPTSGTLDAGLGVVTASADVASLPAGTHTAVCTVAAPGARNSPQMVSVVLTVHSSVESRAVVEALGERVEVLEGIQPPYLADPMGSPIVLVNHDEARDVTLADLLVFLRADATDESPYVQDLRMCGAFAEQLHNNAEAAGIRAAWVSLDLQGQEIGHALNAFVTTDRGLVFVDSTGDNPLAIVSPDGGRGECECDRIAYVRVGSEYGLISIDRAVDPSYDFYVTYSAAWESYLKDVSTFNALASEYNAMVQGRTLVAGSDEARSALRMRAELDAMRTDMEMQREVLGPCRWTTLGVVEFARLYW